MLAPAVSQQENHGGLECPEEAVPVHLDLQNLAAIQSVDEEDIQLDNMDKKQTPEIQELD